MVENNTEARGDAAIELRVDDIGRLFDPFDPFPTPTRDLAEGAEDFIVGWARELPRDLALRIIVHLKEGDVQGPTMASLTDALERHFAYRAERMTGDLHEMFSTGRRTLAIGLCVLGGCMLAGRLVVSGFGATDLSRFIAEGLIILGWVAIWRPIEIFLYDWWPLAQRRQLYRRLANAKVEIRAVREAP